LNARLPGLEGRRQPTAAVLTFVRFAVACGGQAYQQA